VEDRDQGNVQALLAAAVAAGAPSFCLSAPSDRVSTIIKTYEEWQRQGERLAPEQQKWVERAETLLAQAEADGARAFLRAAIPKDMSAELRRFLLYFLGAELKRRHEERERIESERRAAEQQEREYLDLMRELLERERVPLDQRSPIRLPAGMPTEQPSSICREEDQAAHQAQQPVQPEGLPPRATATLSVAPESAHPKPDPTAEKRPRRRRDRRVARRAARTTRRAAEAGRRTATRRSAAAPSFIEEIERRLEKLGDPANMTLSEASAHIREIVVAPLANLNVADLAGGLRAAFDALRVRDVSPVRCRSRARNRGVRSRRHRIPGRGPRAPASADAPPEPPAHETRTRPRRCA
jgi:hypothetical protein